MRRRTFLQVIGCFIATPLLHAKEHIDVKFLRPTRIANDRDGLTVIVQIDVHPDNRILTIALVPSGEDLSGAVHRSDIDLINQNYRTHRVSWGTVEPGEYYYLAIVTNNLHETVGYATISMQVIGMKPNEF